MHIQGIAEADDFARLLNLIPLISTSGCLISIYGEIVSHDDAIIVFRGFGIYKAGTNVFRNDICLSRHRIAIPAAAGHLNNQTVAFRDRLKAFVTQHFT